MTSWVIVNTNENKYRIRSKKPIRGRYKYLSPKPVTYRTAKSLLNRVSKKASISSVKYRKKKIQRDRRAFLARLSKKSGHRPINYNQSNPAWRAYLKRKKSLRRQ